MRCSRTNAATSKVYTLFSYCILRNGRVRAFCSFRRLFGGGSLPLRSIKVCLFCNIRVTFFRCAAKVTTAQNKRRTCYCATPSSQMYILVHLWLRVFCRTKNSFLHGTSDIRVASELTSLSIFGREFRLNTAMDGGRIDQKRCFTKTYFCETHKVICSMDVANYRNIAAAWNHRHPWRFW